MARHLVKDVAAAREARRAAAAAYSADLCPIPEGPREAGRLQGRPWAFLNGHEVLPEVDTAWRPIFHRWVLPGSLVVTTQQLRLIAAMTGATLQFLN